ATAKSPEGIAFLDARQMAVADDLGDALSLVDLVSEVVTPLPIDAADAKNPAGHGSEPSAIAWDPANRRLYVALSGLNAVAANDRVADLDGHPTVQCPPGAAYDFPVPATNTDGASAKIRRIFFIVRENKGFDAVLGDLAGVEGQADLTLKTGPGEMDKVWN